MRRELVEFRSGDFTLRGVWDWPDAQAGDPVPAVIFCHGFTGNRFESRRMYARLGALLAECGIASFRFDHRGCGESDGDFAEFTPKGMLQDLDAALEHFVHCETINPDRTAVMGYSLGGASGSYLLSRRPHFLTAVYWAGVARPEIIRDRLATYPSFAGYRDRGFFDYGGFRVSAEYIDRVGEELRPLEWIRDFSGPMLFLYGQVDDIVKVEQMECYLEVRPGRENQTHIIPGADHAFLPAENIDRVLQMTCDWFHRRL